MAQQIVDDAIQAHGGGGVSDDFGLAELWANTRIVRLTDGPDEVHERQLARIELDKYRAEIGVVSAQPAAMIGQTEEVAPGAQFDEARLTRYLEGAVTGFPRAGVGRAVPGRPVEPDLPARRRPRRAMSCAASRPASCSPPAHAVDREFRITRALFEAGLPVPEPLVLCEDLDVIGTMFYVMRHVPGRGVLGSADAGASAGKIARRSTIRRTTPSPGCISSTMRRWGWTTTAGRATSSPVRSRAGRGNMMPRAPKISPRWTG